MAASRRTTKAFVSQCQFSHVVMPQQNQSKTQISLAQEILSLNVSTSFGTKLFHILSQLAQPNLSPRKLPLPLPRDGRKVLPKHPRRRRPSRAGRRGPSN